MDRWWQDRSKDLQSSFFVILDGFEHHQLDRVVLPSQKFNEKSQMRIMNPCPLGRVQSLVLFPLLVHPIITNIWTSLKLLRHFYLADILQQQKVVARFAPVLQMK